MHKEYLFLLLETCQRWSKAGHMASPKYIFDSQNLSLNRQRHTLFGFKFKDFFLFAVHIIDREGKVNDQK